jgi:hypothetical protein
MLYVHVLVDTCGTGGAYAYYAIQEDCELEAMRPPVTSVQVDERGNIIKEVE